MKLRQANPGDAESIAELHAASWRSTYADVLNGEYLNRTVPSERRKVWIERLQVTKENQFVVVAEDQVGIVGFACVFADNHETWGPYLENLHVSATCQGKGIGRALLAEVARWCESQRAGTGLYLSVNQANERAQNFYQRLGARNSLPGVWNAPDGSLVPTFWFTWSSADLLAKTANPSIERMSDRLRRSATAHVKR